MKRILPLLILLAFSIGSNGFAQSKASKPSGGPEILTNAAIVDLAKAGLGDDLIIAKIEASQNSFDLSSSALVSLKSQKVSNDIIKAMLAKNSPVPVKKETAVKASAGFPAIDLIGQIYLYDKDRNSVNPLDKASATLKTKSKMLGYGGTSVLYTIDGEVAKCRMAIAQPAFVLDAGGGSVPEYTLYKLEVTKGTRQAATTKIGGVGSVFSSKGVVSGGTTITFDVTRVKDGIYQIMPSKPLDKGEYFFASKPTLSATTVDVYAFAID